MTSIFSDLNICLDKIFVSLKKISCDISSYEIDHIGYRTSTLEEAEKTEQLFSEKGTLFSETIVSGRKVCIYRLNEPSIYNGFSIPSIELLYPKTGKLWSGWDHFEVVIPPYTNSLEKFCTSFYEKFPCFSDEKLEIVESMHTFGTTESPTVSITFPDNSLIRFHSIGVLDTKQ